MQLLAIFASPASLIGLIAAGSTVAFFRNAPLERTLTSQNFHSTDFDYSSFSTVPIDRNTPFGSLEISLEENCSPLGNRE